MSDAHFNNLAQRKAQNDLSTALGRGRNALASTLLARRLGFS